MKIGIGQIDPKFGDKKKNLENIQNIVESKKADLWIFPEMCIGGYMFNDKNELKDVAKDISNSNTVGQLAEMAKKQNILIIAGLPEIKSNKMYITAVVVGPNGLMAKNQKTHLFLKEKLLFEPGTTGPTMFEYRGAKIGLGVCYDYMFPEYWRNLALRGADIFINIANFVYDYGFYMMRARAIENGVYSVCVNRTGEERGQKFFGSSELLNSRGKLLYKGGKIAESSVWEIDPALARNKKWNPYNDVIEDRRPEYY